MLSANYLFALHCKSRDIGMWNDVAALVRHYGRKRLKKEVVQIADPRKDTVSFLCLLLNLKTS